MKYLKLKKTSPEEERRRKKKKENERRNKSRLEREATKNTTRIFFYCNVGKRGSKIAELEAMLS